MSPVDFKKRLCRPVEFKDQGPPDSRARSEQLTSSAQTLHS